MVAIANHLRHEFVFILEYLMVRSIKARNMRWTCCGFRRSRRVVMAMSEVGGAITNGVFELLRLEFDIRTLLGGAA